MRPPRKTSAIGYAEDLPFADGSFPYVHAISLTIS
jgi:hypothetical protein